MIAVNEIIPLKYFPGRDFAREGMEEKEFFRKKLFLLPGVYKKTPSYFGYDGVLEKSVYHTRARAALERRDSSVSGSSAAAAVSILSQEPRESSCQEGEDAAEIRPIFTAFM